jgi:hypothetical protein
MYGEVLPFSVNISINGIGIYSRNLIAERVGNIATQGTFTIETVIKEV